MRTNIEIDDKLLEEVMKISNLSTKKDAVNFALDEVVKFHKRKLLLSLRGKIKWEGNLDEMRTYDKWEDNRHQCLGRLFQHGTAPRFANTNTMNPSSVILSGVMMLEYKRQRDAAELITNAAGKTIRNKMVTIGFYNLMKEGTLLKTSEFADAVIKNL